MSKAATLSSALHAGKSAKAGRSRKRTFAVKDGGEIAKLASKAHMPVVAGEKAKALMRSLLEVVSHEDAISVLREVSRFSRAARIVRI
jgi:hypothetical protein